MEPTNNTEIPKKKFLDLKIPFFMVTAVIISVLIGFTIGNNVKITFSTNPQAFSNTSSSNITETQAPNPTNLPITMTSIPETSSELTLDLNKNYGNKFANGILPVGDAKYVNNTSKKGYIDLCNTITPPNGGGAGVRGPWFTNNNTQWDINKKVKVSGSIYWKSNLKVTLSGNSRLITSNGLPNHITGIFPISSTDLAYRYDRNPNKIKEQSLSYTLNANPSFGNPNCLGGGDIGIMLTGVPLFDGFDAQNRDAGAWEVQDGCDGHPQISGEYHYHTLSKCILDQSINTVLGYALDGFPITGPKINSTNILTTDDLDECHGIKSKLTIDGKEVETYHYVMTQDFPYSISCYRSQPIKVANSEGGRQMPNNGQMMQQQP